MNIPYVFKRCTKCGKLLVANSVNFRKSKKGKYGFVSRCKKCDKQYREDNKDKLAEYRKQYYQDNRDKIRERHKQYREDNKDKIKQYYQDNKVKILEHSKQYRQDNKDKITEQRKQHYRDNRGKILERCKQYYQDNKDKLAEYKKQYYKENEEKYAEYRKQYYQDNREKLTKQNKQYYKTAQGQVSAFNSRSKRRIREQTQGNGITTNQWLEMMYYFDWKCAYSGEYIGGKGEHRTIDHIIPLVNDGKNEVWNIVPMYDSYNFSKHDKDMLTWYKEQTFFSEERLNKIYEWQEYAFNKWGYEILDIKEI